MITRSLKLAALAAVLTLSAATQAQSIAPSTTVNVPFAFEVGSTHFAPGVYNLQLQNQRILRVQGTTTTQTAGIMTNPESTLNVAEKGKAVFLHVGDKYFLTQLWTAGSAQHLQCVKTPELTRALRTEEAALRAQPLPVAQPKALPSMVNLATIR